MTDINKIKPTGDKVLVKEEVVQDVTKSGIILPMGNPNHARQGIVIAVGPGRIIEKDPGGIEMIDHDTAKYKEGPIIREEMNVKPGDRVCFGKFTGMELTIDDEKYLMMHESNILGVIEDE